MDRPASVEGLIVAGRVAGQSAEELPLLGHNADLGAGHEEADGFAPVSGSDQDPTLIAGFEFLALPLQSGAAFVGSRWENSHRLSRPQAQVLQTPAAPRSRLAVYPSTVCASWHLLVRQSCAARRFGALTLES